MSSLLFVQSLLSELIENHKCTVMANYKVFACFFVLSNKPKIKPL